MKKIQILFIVLSVFIVNSITPLFGQNWKNEISSYYFYIKAAKSDKVWDLPGKHPATAKRGVQFQIWENDQDKYEKAFAFPQIKGTDVFAIKNLAGYIVDVSGKDKLNLKEQLQKKTGKKFKMKTDNGAEIQTWEQGSKGIDPWQQWRLIVVDKNTVMFENVFTHKAIDMKGGGKNIDTNGTKLVSWDRNNSDAQQYQLIYLDGPNQGKPLDFEK